MISAICVSCRDEVTNAIRRSQRWCNNKFIFKKCHRFEDYKIGI